MLRIEKLKNFEKSIEKMDEILSNQRSLDDKTRLEYNNSFKTIETGKSSK